VRLAVDAWNLVDDRRGMGRYVRRVLTDWQESLDLEITLIVRKPAHIDALRKEFSYEVTTGVQGAFDAAWFPWNAMRFDVGGARSTVLFHDAFAFTHPHRDFIARWREQSPIRRAMERADERAVNSHWSASELARVFKRNVADFTVIHPVPDPFWTPAETHARAPYVLVVAGPEERKNLPTLVRAFARAFTRGECELVIVGNVSANDAWMIERSGIRYERVRANDQELRGLYGNALAVAVPSIAEGYGIMAVEAMACGAPVIASNAAALPEACDDAAILVPSLDVEAWGFALERVVNDATLRETMREQSLGRAARIDRTEPARLTLALIRRSLEAAR
jgi:glycosyltransferase involved in cell wall biosynthesis